MTTLDASVEALRKVREDNHGRFPELSLDPEAIKSEIINFICIKLGNDPEWCIGPPVGSIPKAFRLSLLRPAASVNVAGVSKPMSAPKPGFISNATAGIGLYLEWFGEGRPVDQLTAESRAATCIGCPKHVKGNILQRFNDFAAKEIMAVFGILNDFNLKTSRDDQLAICDACDCPMKAKVWSPIEIIKKHIRPEAEAALWDQCWIRKEAS